MSEFITALSSNLLFGLFLSLGAYFIGVWINKKLPYPMFNPMIISMVIIIPFLLVFKIDYATYNQGASLLSFLLGPVTVAFALPLYRHLDILKKNWAVLLTGIFSGSVSSLVSVFVFCKLFSLSPEIYYSLLSKSVTASIGIGIAAEVGGITSLAVPMISITGIFGAVTAVFFLKLFRITNPTAKGLACGTCSHAMGTSQAMKIGDVEGAMSSLALVVAGVITVFLAPFAAMLM